MVMSIIQRGVYVNLSLFCQSTKGNVHVLTQFQLDTLCHASSSRSTLKLPVMLGQIAIADIEEDSWCISTGISGFCAAVLKPAAPSGPVALQHAQFQYYKTSWACPSLGSIFHSLFTATI